MSDNLRIGDRVQWNTSGGTTLGTVKKRLTEPTMIKGHRAVASPDHPQYLVQSDHSGELSAHRPEALEKVRKE